MAKMGPMVLRNTLGVVAPELKHYILYLQAVQFYVGAAAWACGSSLFPPEGKRRTTDEHEQPTGSRSSL